MISLICEIEKLFKYNTIAKNMWNDKISESQKEFNINFDTENNDSCSSIRDIIIPQKEENKSDCKIRCQMWCAGGDWQVPIRYFKCQLLEGYIPNKSLYSSSQYFIFIPGKTEGNYHLVRNSKRDGWRVPDNGDEYKKGIDPEVNERDCWKSLTEYLTKLVNLEIQKEDE